MFFFIFCLKVHFQAILGPFWPQISPENLFGHFHDWLGKVFVERILGSFLCRTWRLDVYSLSELGSGERQEFRLVSSVVKTIRAMNARGTVIS